MSRIESDYYAHMGFDPVHSKKVRSHYVDYFEGADLVLELACGRGEFLTLLSEHGIPCEGVDRDEGMTAAARAAGHDVTLADALDFVREAEPETYDGVFCAHVLEHLQPEQVSELVEGIGRILRPGGQFVAVVPNPACYAVLTHDFWNDPTHIRFYDLPLIAFFCERGGLEVVEQRGNPLDHPGAPPGYEAALSFPGDDLSDQIRDLLDGDPSNRKVQVMLNELNRRLLETQAALRMLEAAHRALVQGMYQPNEIYVVARR